MPQRKDPIPNQDSNIIINQQDPKLPPHLEKGTTGHKPFIDYTHFSNPIEKEHTDTTDNVGTDNEHSADKMILDKDEYKDDEYKGGSPHGRGEPPIDRKSVVLLR